MKKFSLYLVLLSMPLWLSACSQTQYAAHMTKQLIGPSSGNEPTGYFKVGTPYRIAGELYHPRESYRHVETGMASWYGPNFHGKMTANGEIFNKYDLTAAHRTLQMPSIIRVTNLENGKNIILRVNDRGPFAKNRVLDVSQRASEILGFRKQGTARVKIEVLEEESKKVAQLAKDGQATRGVEVALNQRQTPDQFRGLHVHDVRVAQTPAPAQKPVAQGALEVASVTAEPLAAPPLPPQNPDVYVQAGAFSMEQNAMALSERLSVLGPSRVSLARVDGRPFYRVRLGPFDQTAQADQVLTAVIDKGHSTAKIVKD